MLDSITSDPVDSIHVRRRRLKKVELQSGDSTQPDKRREEKSGRMERGEEGDGEMEEKETGMRCSRCECLIVSRGLD